jgi:hypothetical protein
MATKSKVKSQKVKAEETKPAEVKKEELLEEEGQLDPQEEKVLDWILKAVVAFILGWLGLSILMVIGGYFGIWG